MPTTSNRQKRRAREDAAPQNRQPPKVRNAGPQAEYCQGMPEVIAKGGNRRSRQRHPRWAWAWGCEGGDERSRLAGTTCRDVLGKGEDAEAAISRPPALEVSGNAAERGSPPSRRAGAVVHQGSCVAVELPLNGRWGAADELSMIQQAGDGVARVAECAAEGGKARWEPCKFDAPLCDTFDKRLPVHLRKRSLPASPIIGEGHAQRTHKQGEPSAGKHAAPQAPPPALAAMLGPKGRLHRWRLGKWGLGWDLPGPGPPLLLLPLRLWLLQMLWLLPLLRLCQCACERAADDARLRHHLAKDHGFGLGRVQALP